MISQQIKAGISVLFLFHVILTKKYISCVIPHFYGIFTLKSIYSIILMFQGHL